MWAKGHGSFEVWKKFEGDYAQKFDTNQVFRITYKTQAPGETDFSEAKTIEIPAFNKGKPKETEFPVNTKVLIEEALVVGSPTSPEPIDGKRYVWATPVLKVAGKPVADNIITIEAKKTITAEMFNRPEPVANGTLFVRKVLNAQPALNPVPAHVENFNFDVTCNQAAEGDVLGGDGSYKKTVSAAANGTAVSVGVFPVGTECSVVEQTANIEIEGYDRVAPTMDPATGTVIIAAGNAEDNNLVTVTNTYTKIKTGKLFITKSVAPDSAVAEGSTKTAQVTMKCSAAPLEKPAGSPEITPNTAFTIPVPATGADVEIGTFPVGTVCNDVAETNAAELGIAHHELPTPSYNTQTHTIVEGEAATLNRFEVTNTYAPIQYVPFKVKKNFVGLIGDVKPAALKATAMCNAASKAGRAADTAIELPVKLDGTDTVFGEFPVGTTCKVTGEIVDPVNNYALVNQAISPQVVLANNADNRLTLTNTYEFKKGAFKFKKVVADTDSTLPAGQKFEFSYRCEQPETKAVNENKVSLGHNEEHVVTDIPVSSVCQVEEGAKITKVVEWTVSTDKEATITVAENAEPIVTFTNTFTKPLGGFTIAKAVSVADAQKNLPVEVPKDFTFDYSCELPAITGSEIAFDLGAPATGTLTLKAGETKTVSGVVAGSACTITEKNSGAADSNVATVVTVDGTETAGVTAKVTVVKDALAKVSYTNTYAAHAGVVVVNKVLDGSAKELAAVKDHTFAATVVCTKGSFNKTYPVQLKAGTPVEIPDVPVGAECKVSETLTGNDIAGARFDTDPASVTDVVVPAITHGNKSEVTLTNVYTELGAVKITKTLAGISAGQGKDKTFTVTAKWQDKGVEVVRELTLAPGVEQVINNVPVGAEVMFTERLPENTALASWNVPEFLGGEQVVDHKNGSAVVRVTAGSFVEGIKVELRNTANPPAWWLLLGAIPLVAAVSPRLPVPPAVSPQAPNSAVAPRGPQGSYVASPESAQVLAKTPEQKAKGVVKEPAAKKGLANTGANVLWVLLGGLLLAALGGILIALRRRES
ncbi:DUF5979 domain-containing protein [Corynebacterium felinum]|nr:DUF5979 domain-containing protein [Corynebacterium felinum]MDF5821436.1 DUF5979 domain-containing protein [Corynebacterium felinum]